MLWCDYAARKPGANPPHWIEQAASIVTVERRTQDFRFCADRHSMRVDPLVLPYLAQVFIMFEKSPVEGLRSLAEQIDKRIFREASSTEAASVLCEGLLVRLRQPNQMLTTTILRQKILEFIDSMSEPCPWYGDRMRHTLVSEIDQWLYRARIESARAAFLPDFGNSCFIVAQQYVDHLFAFVSGTKEFQTVGNLSIPVDRNFLQRIESELNIDANEAIEFRRRCVLDIAGAPFFRKPKSFVSFKPLQFAIERAVISSLDSFWLHDPLFTNQARARIQSLFGIEADKAHSMLDMALVRQ